MLEQLSKLEENVSSSSMPEENKKEILAHIDNLRLEYISSKDITRSHIGIFEKLRKSIYEFEKDHPFLVKNINEISSMLSISGI